MATDLNLAECASKFSTKRHHEYPERLQCLIGTLTHPTLGKLATVRCLQIQRRIWFKGAGDFLEVMDAVSQELHQFSMVLFDKNSNVRPWLVNGGAKCGSGCWDTDLSIGDMLYIEDLEVKEEFRRHGVGSWLLQELLTSPAFHIGYKGHAFCWPTPNRFTADDKAGRLEEQDVITTFYRKNGFRRVGLSQFLAYSPDPLHPARRLPIASDPETPARNFDSANPNAPDLTPDEIQTQYPLHCAIATDKTPSIAQVIRLAYHSNRGSLRIRDHNGFTPVHMAACSQNVYALRTFLELDPSGMAKDLKFAMNKEGMTPLEALGSSMRSTREFMETLMHKWDGYNDDDLHCEYLMQKALGGLPGAETEGNYIKKRKFGCTCGMCTGGWLSPRMRFRLAAQAALQHDILRPDLDLFKSYHPLSAYEIFHGALDYLPHPLQREIYKPFYIGFYTIFRAIRDILRTTEIPTPQAVLAEALALDARPVQFYLANGGKVEYALDATVNIAREQSNLGDGTFEETFEDESDEEGEEPGYTALEKCLNDLEFGIVRRKIGLVEGVSWGPYEDKEEDQGMELDEDDDDDDDSDWDIR